MQENCLLNDGKRPSIKEILEKHRNCMDIFGLREAKITFVTLEKEPEDVLPKLDVIKIESIIQSNPK